MAWTTPGTATAGSVLTASFWNTQVRDNMVELAPFSAAWVSYTPTLSQGATTDITKTVSYAKYMRVGKIAYVNMRLDITGTGTTANAVTVTLPISASKPAADVPIGSGWYYDQSALNAWMCIAVAASSTTARILADQASGAYFGVTPNMATGNQDVLYLSMTYETT